MATARERISREAAEKTGTLNLRDLGLTDLPAELLALDHLQVLRLGRMSRLAELIGPSFGVNMITGRLDGLSRLTSLVGLDLSGLGLSGDCQEFRVWPVG